MHLTGTVVIMLIVAALFGAGLWLWTPDKARSDLEAKYLRAKSDYVEVESVRLHLRDTGPKQAPAIILIHGFGSSLHTWEPWAQSLAKSYRVIRFDVPGFGLTGPDPTGDYSDQRAAAVLKALMDSLGLAQAAYIGNSMGGRIAWKFASIHPDRVSKLVLISPDGFASPGIEYGKRTQVPLMVKLMRYTLPKAFLAPNLSAAYANPAFMNEALLNRYYDLMLAPGVRDAIIARMEQSVLTDPVPDLRRIEAKTLILWGERDALIPVSNAADYVRVLRHAELVTLPGVGHLPQEEAPETSLKPVLDFLAH